MIDSDIRSIGGVFSTFSYEIEFIMSAGSKDLSRQTPFWWHEQSTEIRKCYIQSDGKTLVIYDAETNDRICSVVTRVAMSIERDPIAVIQRCQRALPGVVKTISLQGGVLYVTCAR